MEFNGFRPEGLDILIENRLMNSKAFYEEHKAQIRTLVQEPFYALIEKIAPAMCKIDPLFVVDPPRMLSRVRRDTRFTKDKMLYRDHMWFFFGQRKEPEDSRVCYYFEISPTYWAYGCGFLGASTKEKNMTKQMILQEDRTFVKAFEAVTQCKGCAFYGDTYKRIRYPEALEKYQPWLQQKEIGISCEKTNFDVLWNANFVDKMIKDLQKLAPFYQFLCTAKQRARTVDGENAL